MILGKFRSSDLMLAPPIRTWYCRQGDIQRISHAFGPLCTLVTKFRKYLDVPLLRVNLIEGLHGLFVPVPISIVTTYLSMTWKGYVHCEHYASTED